MNPSEGARRLKQEHIEVPDKYRSVEKTPLEIEVKDNPESGAYDLKLTK